jgi:hypothetical protein
MHIIRGFIDELSASLRTEFPVAGLKDVLQKDFVMSLIQRFSKETPRNINLRTYISVKATQNHFLLNLGEMS